MADNPRQFTSLDYANADMYGALTDKPPTATPLNLPLENLSSKKPSGGISPGEAAYYREEEERRRSLFLEQKEAQASREAALKEREIARNLALQQTKSPELEKPSVSDRDYEKNFQPSTSTPDRQPSPSTGAPPPTPNNTAARASPLVEPTATPTSATLKEPISSSAGVGLAEALPRSLPQAAGRLVVPGVIAGVDFASRVVHGQSIVQAASGTGAVLVGSVALEIVGTAVAGPIGGVIGGMVGGIIGGDIANFIWSQTPPAGTEHLTTNTPNYPPFRGGQAPGVQYRVTGSFDVVLQSPSGESLYGERTVETVVPGPIASIEFKNGGIDGPIGFVVTSDVLDQDGNPQHQFPQVGHPAHTIARNPHNIKVSRVDGTNEVYPDLTAPAPPPDNQPYYFAGASASLNTDNTVPSGKPAAGLKKGKNRDVVPGIPANNTPNSNASFFPGHGGLAPSKNPNPTQVPSNLGGGLPAIKQPPPPPLPFAEPDDIPAPRTITFNTPGGGTVTSSKGGGLALGPPSFPGSTVKYDSQGNVLPTGIDGEDPYSFKPNPLVANPLVANGLQPSGLPTTTAPHPISDAQSSVPKSNTVPKPETSSQAETRKQSDNNEATKKAIEEQVKKLIEIGALIAGLTPVINGIPDAIAHSPTVQAANKATTQNAVCEIAQPGKCLGNALDNSADKINQNNDKNANNILDKINTGANAAQLALLELINTKLGNLLPNGGISAFLQNFFEGFNKLTEWLHLDRALNILTFVMTVQNVYFLCDSLKVVTLQMISDMLAVVGIKDKDNNPLNLNEILGHEVEELLKSILGEEELTGFKKEWKALNRIYQAATNTLFAIQNMVFSVLQALEIIGSWNASIGNALKKYLVVGQHAFNWMNPQPNFHNNFFKFLGEALNVVTSLDFVAQSILQGRQAIDDFGKQTEELSKGMSDAADGFKPPEHKATAEAATNSTNVSKSPIPSPEEVKSVQD